MQTKTVTDLIREAKLSIENLLAEQLKEELLKDNTVLIDIRESEELKQNGKIPGSVHAPRGMLEFYSDPLFPYYKPEFEKEKRIVLHCASGSRSALAAWTLKGLGYTNVAHLEGGFKAWKEAGLPTTTV